MQDEIKLAESASFTIGTKLEHNAFTGFEFEPSAIRQPSLQDTDLQYDVAVIPLEGNGFGVLKIINNNNIQAEQLRDYEVGYRTLLNTQLSLDVAVFRSYYRRLETTAAVLSHAWANGKTERRSHNGYRNDRACDGRLQGKVPRGGHGRIRNQADRGRPVAAGSGGFARESQRTKIFVS